MAEDGSLTKLPSQGYGRYVITETDREGVFILAGACVLVAAVVVTLIVKRRRKKLRTV